MDFEWTNRPVTKPVWATDADSGTPRKRVSTVNYRFIVFTKILNRSFRRGKLGITTRVATTPVRERDRVNIPV